MSTTNNIHRLTDDWRMYFCNSYIFALIDGNYRVMSVDDVVRTGDDRGTNGMQFQGHSWGLDGEPVYQEWSADIREEFRPISGYYDVGGRKPSWITFHIPNRTQRKGLDSRNILVDGVPGGINPVGILKMFIQGLELVSKPGTRDFLKLEDGRVFWKGIHVGSMTDGVLVCNETHKNKEAMLWRLLQTI